MKLPRRMEEYLVRPQSAQSSSNSSGSHRLKERDLLAAACRGPKNSALAAH